MTKEDLKYGEKPKEVYTKNDVIEKFKTLMMIFGGSIYFLLDIEGTLLPGNIDELIQRKREGGDLSKIEALIRRIPPNWVLEDLIRGLLPASQHVRDRIMLVSASELDIPITQPGDALEERFIPVVEDRMENDYLRERSQSIIRFLGGTNEAATLDSVVFDIDSILFVVNDQVTDFRPPENITEYIERKNFLSSQSLIQIGLAVPTYTFDPAVKIPYPAADLYRNTLRSFSFAIHKLKR